MAEEKYIMEIEEMGKDLKSLDDVPYHPNCNYIYRRAEKLKSLGYIKQKWISVDDKLPKHCQKVLVCDERHNMVTAMYVTYDNGGFDWCTSVRLVYKVTHWMPLPEPPETKGETE